MQVLVPSVSYLGYVIDSKGLHPQPNKVRNIEDAPTPISEGLLRTPDTAEEEISIL